MPVNGLLLTLTHHAELAAAARTQIARHPAVSLGDASGRWQPLAIETPDVKASHDFHEWLEAIPGVEQVDVIYVGFDEPTLTETAP